MDGEEDAGPSVSLAGEPSSNGSDQISRSAAEPAIPSSEDETVEKLEMEAPPSEMPGGGWRVVVASGMESFSRAVNDNLVAARYGTFATIALLSAYGVSKTPLLFRYKTVYDIPGSHFAARRTVHGRLVRIVENDAIPGTDDAEKPIVCLVRHMSPAGRLLNRSAFNFFSRASPAAAVGKRLEDNKEELLKVEIAAVKAPPFYVASSHLEQPGEWLRRLAEHRTPVACQLLARRVKKKVVDSNQTKRDATTALPELRESIEREKINPEDQIAVCRLGYRPGMQLFRTDVAKSLVRYGRASVLSSLYVSDASRTTMDTSSRLEDLRADAAYLDKLGEAECEAAKEYLGMWTDSRVREDNKDTIDEANFQANAGILQRIWRYFRG